MKKLSNDDDFWNVEIINENIQWKKEWRRNGKGWWKFIQWWNDKESVMLSSQWRNWYLDEEMKKEKKWRKNGMKEEERKVIQKFIEKNMKKKRSYEVAKMIIIGEKRENVGWSKRYNNEAIERKCIERRRKKKSIYMISSQSVWNAKKMKY